MCQDCQHSNFCYDCIFAKQLKKCLVSEANVQGWSRCVQIDTKGEITTLFKNSKQQVHIAKDQKKVAFKGLNLVATFFNNIVPKLDFDHEKKIVAVKIEKSPRTCMEISSIEEGDFDFGFEEISEDKDTRFALIHFPPQKVLPREVKNIEYIDGSDSAHSLDDEEGSDGLLAKKTMTRNDQLDVVDPHTENLKSCSKVKLSTKGGFQELNVPKFSSLSQIQVGMDEV